MTNLFTNKMLIFLIMFLNTWSLYSITYTLRTSLHILFRLFTTSASFEYYAINSSIVQRIVSSSEQEDSIIYSSTVLPVMTMFSDGLVYYINEREYRPGNQEWTIHWVHKKQKHSTIC